VNNLLLLHNIVSPGSKPPILSGAIMKAFRRGLKRYFRTTFDDAMKESHLMRVGSCLQLVESYQLDSHFESFENLVNGAFNRWRKLSPEEIESARKSYSGSALVELEPGVHVARSSIYGVTLRTRDLAVDHAWNLELFDYSSLTWPKEDFDYPALRSQYEHLYSDQDKKFEEQLEIISQNRREWKKTISTS